MSAESTEQAISAEVIEEQDEAGQEVGQGIGQEVGQGIGAAARGGATSQHRTAARRIVSIHLPLLPIELWTAATSPCASSSARATARW